MLFQVYKTHKTNIPSKKTNSKRKTLNGCGQICIKTVKMSQKREKPQGARPWKLWREVEDDGAAGLPHADLISWSYHPCHSKLWNYHYELQNYKSATIGLKCWPIDFADVEMTWKWCGNDVVTLFNWILMSKLQNCFTQIPKNN